MCDNRPSPSVLAFDENVVEFQLEIHGGKKVYFGRFFMLTHVTPKKTTTVVIFCSRS